MNDAEPGGDPPGPPHEPPGDRPRRSRDEGEQPDGPSRGFGRFLQRTGRSARMQTVLGAAGIVALGFLLSRVFGLVRSIVIADAFGTDPDLDAFWVAFRLPDLVFQLLAGATLSAAFIPTFSRILLRRGEEEAWLLASNVLNLVAVATFILAALAFLFAPWIVPLFASGASDDVQSLGVDLTRFMLLSPLFFGVSGMLTGILNARQHFVAPAFAPVIYNLSIIGGALFLVEPFGIYGLAWGVVIGSVGHLLLQAPVLRTVGMRWSPSFDLFSPGVQDVMRLMGPRILAQASNQINFLALIFFASFLIEGAISAINYAFLLVMLPVGVIGMSISTAAFPTLAQQAAAGETWRLRMSLTRALRMILFLAIPASLAMALLAEPVVRLLLERGAFDAVSTRLVVTALSVYALSVTAQCGVEILSRGFYALEDTRTPVAIALMAMVVNITLAALLVGPFELRGLAAAATVAASIEFLLLMVLLHGRIGGFELFSLQRTAVSTIIGSVVMGQVIVIVLLVLGATGPDAGTFTGAVVRLLLASSLGGLAFLVVTFLLNREDYAIITRRRILGR